jgi:hypothetical protein
MKEIGWLAIVLALVAVLFCGCIQPKATVSIIKDEKDRQYVVFEGYNISIAGGSITSNEQDLTQNESTLIGQLGFGRYTGEMIIDRSVRQKFDPRKYLDNFCRQEDNTTVCAKNISAARIGRYDGFSGHMKGRQLNYYLFAGLLDKNTSCIVWASKPDAFSRMRIVPT